MTAATPSLSLADAPQFALTPFRRSTSSARRSPRQLERATHEEVFTRSQLSWAIRYERNSGRVLAGVAPVHVVSDLPDNGSTADELVLVTGSLPHALTFSTPMASQTQQVLVRDATAITAVGGLTDVTLAKGKQQCLDKLVSVGALGATIQGTPPTRPRLSISGDAWVVSPERLRDLCLEAVATGTSTLEVSWGNGSTSHAWTVTP